MWHCFFTHLDGLALVNFNNVKVKAVDSFPGTQEHGFQREIASYVDKNLQNDISEVLKKTRNKEFDKCLYSEIQLLFVLFRIYSCDAERSWNTLAGDYNRQLKWKMHSVMHTCSGEDTIHDFLLSFNQQMFLIQGQMDIKHKSYILKLCMLNLNVLRIEAT